MYEVRFASERVAKEFAKSLDKLPKKDQQRIYQALSNLAENPRPGGKKFKFLEKELIFYQFVAHYRLRVGDCRIFYDVDDSKKVVILLSIERKGKNIYD